MTHKGSNVVMKGWTTVVALGLMFLAGPAYAQQAPAQVPAPPRVDAEATRTREQIVNMENLLTQAVRNGAKRLVSQFPRVAASPESVFLGQPQAVGFRLRGHGMFFYVRVPPMRSSFRLAAPLAAQQADRSRARQVSSAGPGQEGPPPVDPLDVDVLSDPDAAYTREIKSALVDAMLENSGALRIGSDEFLTVAAKDDTRPDPLALMDDVHTMTFSVKGSDLAALHQKQISLDEARQLVTVQED